MKDKNIELFEELVKKQVITPMRRSITNYINRMIINKENDKVNKEITNLFYQANDSLKTVRKLLNTHNVIDSATLMRSSMEKSAMAITIYYDQINAYREYLNHKKCGKGEYTRPNEIIKNYDKKLKEINPTIFSDIDNNIESNNEKLLYNMYDYLCKYTHSSTEVSRVVEMKKDNNEYLICTYFELIEYNLEIILYVTLKYMCKDTKNHIDYICFSLWYIWLLMNKGNIDIENLEKIQKYSIPLKNNKQIFELQKQIENIFTILDENNEFLDSYLNNLILSK